MPNCQPSLFFTPDTEPVIGCGGCCGLFNIQAGTEERKQLLEDRTTDINELIRRTNNQAEPDRRTYFFAEAQKTRAQFEKHEAEAYPERFDKEIYSCIFLGYLDSGGSKQLGCLIHPTRTEIERSQNASFYGASICSDYDCPNKEAGFGGVIARLAYEFCLQEGRGSFEYTLLMCDTMFWHYLERIFHSLPDELNETLIAILRLRLDPAAARRELFRLTSFEVPDRNPKMTAAEAKLALTEYLGSPKVQVLLDNKAPG